MFYRPAYVEEIHYKMCSINNHFPINPQLYINDLYMWTNAIDSVVSLNMDFYWLLWWLQFIIVTFSSENRYAAIFSISCRILSNPTSPRVSISLYPASRLS